MYKPVRRLTVVGLLAAALPLGLSAGVLMRLWPARRPQLSTPGEPAGRPLRGPARTTSESSVLEHFRDQGGDRGALRANQGHVGEQRMALELLDDGHDAVVPADPEVVALRDVVGEHHP